MLSEATNLSIRHVAGQNPLLESLLKDPHVLLQPREKKIAPKDRRVIPSLILEQNGTIQQTVGSKGESDSEKPNSQPHAQ
jgi:hypothetical protein